MRLKTLAFGLAVGLAAIGGARANEALFNVVDIDIGGGIIHTLTFELPQSPTIPVFYQISNYFWILDVPAVLDGHPILDDFGFQPNISFFDFDILVDGENLLNFDLFGGPQLYKGPENSPTFLPGVYSGVPNLLTGGTDTVSVVIVPEASTWSMMIAGFACLSLVGWRFKWRSAPLAV